MYTVEFNYFDIIYKVTLDSEFRVELVENLYGEEAGQVVYAAVMDAMGQTDEV